MRELELLNQAVCDLEELWQLCQDPALADELLDKRDHLDQQAQRLTCQLHQVQGQQLNELMHTLIELNRNAHQAKEELMARGRRMAQTTAALNKAAEVITKMGALRA